MTTQNMTAQEADSIIDSALLTSQEPVVPDTDKTVPFPVPDTTEDETNLTPEEKQAKADQAKIDQAQEDMLGKEEAEALREEEQKRVEREKTLVGLAEKALQSTKARANSTSDLIARAPTPGNITFPLLLLILLFFVLISYGGHTRFQWAWMVLTGNAYISASPQNNNTGGGPPIPSQESLIGQIALPAYTSNGLIGGNPF